MKNIRGNALFLILIAVALFAALSYAVTTSGRGGGDTNKEQNLIAASQITQQAAAVRTAVTRMIITGTAIADLDFASQGTGEDAVFGSSGGGALFPELPASAQGADIPGASFGWAYKTDIFVEDVGTAADDPTMVACELTQAICEQINKGLGETASPLPAATAIVVNCPSGTSADINNALCSDCVGKPFLCTFDAFPNPDGYFYYHVLAEQ